VMLVNNIDVIFRHYLYILSRTNKSWYQDRGFLILPELIPHLTNSIVLPDIKVKDRSNLLSDIQNIDINKNYFDALEDISKYANYFSDGLDWSIFLSNKIYQEDKIKVAIKETFCLFKKLFPFLKDVTNLDVKILPLKFGAQCSFFSKVEKDTLYIFIVIREDMSFDYILDAYVSSLVALITGGKMEKEVTNWKSREEIGEFLLYNTNISKYINFDKHKKTLEMLNDENLQTVENVQLSKEYLKHLKMALPRTTLIDWDLFNEQLSYQEKIVAQKLYENKNRIVSYDDIASALYGEKAAEMFSLQHFAKVIENIRKKLYQIGIRNNQIFTKRGIGYVWIA